MSVATSVGLLVCFLLFCFFHGDTDRLVWVASDDTSNNSAIFAPYGSVTACCCAVVRSSSPSESTTTFVFCTYIFVLAPVIAVSFSSDAALPLAGVRGWRPAIFGGEFLLSRRTRLDADGARCFCPSKLPASLAELHFGGLRGRPRSPLKFNHYVFPTNCLRQRSVRCWSTYQPERQPLSETLWPFPGATDVAISPSGRPRWLPAAPGTVVSNHHRRCCSYER